jgi:hypothetical protein
LLKVHGEHAIESRGASVLEGLFKVQGIRMGEGNFFAIDGAVKRLGSFLTDPAASDKTLEDGGHLKGPILA